MLVARLLLSRAVTSLPRRWFARMDSAHLHWEDPKLKRIGYNKPFKKISWSDELKLPEQQLDEIGKIYLHVMKNDIQNYTSQSLAALVYNFGKEGMMTPMMFDRLYDQLPKFEGEFTTRSLFGFLWTAVKYNNKKYLAFFLEILEQSHHAFTPGETLQMIDALRVNKAWPLSRKKQFWNKYFFEHLREFMTLKYRDNNYKKVLKILRNLQYLEVYDRDIWVKLIGLLDNKRGWSRIDIYEALSPHMERFPEAQELVDKIYGQVSNNPDVIWRYNLAERRLYTNAEMIAKSQDNIKLIPDFQSIFPMVHVKELNEKYQQLKATGTLLEEAQIQHDKAKALAYVLYDKFNLDKEAGDINSARQYERVYGMNEQELKKLIDEAENEQLKSDDDEDDDDTDQEANEGQEDDEQEDESGDDGDQQQESSSESQESSSDDD